MKKSVIAIMMCAAMIGTGGINVLAEEAADGYVGDGGSYSMYLRSTFIDWINDLEWYKEAEARTGIKVEYQKGTDEENAVYPEIDQMVLSRTLTDATMCRQDQANIYGAAGCIL